MLLSGYTLAHTIYAANDISLLDNRFRIDPNTEQVTIILNHPSHSQKTVLVRPDGSKLYAQRHPEQSVAWFNNRNQDIITIQNPMPGPWQAIATLNGENRIQLLNPTQLKIEKLPLKVYNKEYLTSYIALINDNKVMTNKDFLKNARLTVSIDNDDKKLVSVYKDDGRYYDSLPFDGKLTTHFFMDIEPGRYLLNIKTRNNIFIRAYNTDIVVFPQPLTYQIEQLGPQVSTAKLSFTVDTTEIDASTVIIDGTLTSNNKSEQSIVHLDDLKIEQGLATINIPLAYQAYTYSGKVYATTLDGREVNFELPTQDFQLLAPPVIKTTEISTISEAKATDSNKITENKQEQAPIPSSNLWIWISVLISLLIIVSIAVVIFLRRKKQKNSLAENELSLDELTSEPKSSEKNDKK